LQKVPGLTIYGDASLLRVHTRSGVIPFILHDVPSHLVSAILGFEWGIGVRSGCFCAHPYVMSLLGLNPKRIRSRVLHNRRDLVPGLVRISFGLYNTTDEIDVLIEALTAIAKGQYASYTVDDRTGQYLLKNVQENFSNYFAL
jgi:selenocysteine lyase/cysteine desulfurase